jgi:hypothetical protein
MLVTVGDALVGALTLVDIFEQILKNVRATCDLKVDVAFKFP